MQTTGTPTTTPPDPELSNSAGKPGSRRSRWRRDLQVVRSSMPRGIGLVLGVCVVGLLATAASGLANDWRNFAQNTAADLIGAIVAMYVIIPIAQRPRPDVAPRDDTKHESCDDTDTKAQHDPQPARATANPPAITTDTIETPTDPTT